MFSKKTCLTSSPNLIFISTSMLLFILVIRDMKAQNFADAVRYTEKGLGSSARYRALSGAFGAIGGDLSAMSSNPASSAVFSNHQGGISIVYSGNTNKSTFLRQSSNDSFKTFNFNQAGAILVFNNTKRNSLINRISFGVNYDTNSDFNTRYTIKGHNTKSIDKYFLYYANGKPLSFLTLQEGESFSSKFNLLSYLPSDSYNYQQAFLGYQFYLLNPITNIKTNTKYTSNIYSPKGTTQKYDITHRGFSEKTTFNFATRLRNKIYLGINLNYNLIKYQKSIDLFEDGYDKTSVIGHTRFKNVTLSHGQGFSFQVGTIVKFTPFLRLGLSYNSPIYYEINEQLTQSIETLREDTSELISNPKMTSVFKYQLETHTTLNASLAYIFGKKGFLCFDYIFEDFSKNKFKPDSSKYIQNQNSMIKSTLRGVSEFRLGGEYRLKKWAFRGGIRLKESPYKNQTFKLHYYNIGNLKGYSLGLGYSFEYSNLDLTYDGYFRDGSEQLYDNLKAFDNSFSYKKILNTISLSYRFRF